MFALSLPTYGMQLGIPWRDYLYGIDYVSIRALFVSITSEFSHSA